MFVNDSYINCRSHGSAMREINYLCVSSSIKCGRVASRENPRKRNSRSKLWDAICSESNSSKCDYCKPIGCISKCVWRAQTQFLWEFLIDVTLDLLLNVKYIVGHYNLHVCVEKEGIMMFVTCAIKDLYDSHFKFYCIFERQMECQLFQICESVLQGYIPIHCTQNQLSCMYFWKDLNILHSLFDAVEVCEIVQMFLFRILSCK